ncbi:unnamed protein product [Caenorhabditis brenneri]
MMFNDDDAPEEATFPLLGLPNQVIKRVINQMSIFRIFGLSLISKRSCKLVSDSYHNKWGPAVTIGNAIQISIDLSTHFTFRPSHEEIDQSPIQKVKLAGPVNTWTGYDYYSKPGYTMKDWVDHIFKTFNCPYDKVYFGWQNNTGKYSVASVKRIFPKCDRLMINISNPQFELVTDTLLPKFIEVGRNVFEELHLTKRMQKIQMQNFSHVVFSNIASFDTLLMANSKCFEVSAFNLTDKEANRFLKLWTRGAMPNLQHFSSAVRRGTQSMEETIERVFRGIKHSYSIEHIQCRECSSRKCGGFVVYRVGGTRAVVNLYPDNSDEYFLFDIFVEH